MPQLPTSDPQDLERQIAELEATLQLPLPEVARQPLVEKLQALLAQRAGQVSPPTSASGDILSAQDITASTAAIGEGAVAHSSTHGSVEQSGTTHGAVVGVNQGTIQVFFGTGSPPDAKELLDSYLDSLVASYGSLRLGKLLGKEQPGTAQQKLPTLRLRAVYTALATNGRLPGDTFRLTINQIREALEKADPRRGTPDQVRLPVLDSAEERGLPHALRSGTQTLATGTLTDHWLAAKRALPSDRDERTRYAGRWFRPELAVATMAAPQARVVLLGDPGSGKSTVLRYLVVALAETMLDGRERGLDLLGWQEQVLPVPLFCQLGRVARELGDDPERDLDTLIGALLRPVLADELRSELKPTLLAAWRRGGALLCLDGLDEVTSTPAPTRAGSRSPRERIATAIQRLGEQIGKARIVLTCRIRPYQQDTAWQLPDPWLVRTIEPFAAGQVRHFVATWYQETCAQSGAKYPPEAAPERATQLVVAIERERGLTELATNPLQLTSLTLLHYNAKQLPEERADVYEELVKLLLERWDELRSETPGGREESFGARLGLPELRTQALRPALHELAFEAHRSEVDGRGVIDMTLLTRVLVPFFRRQIDPDQRASDHLERCMGLVGRFVTLLVAETGIVQPEGDGRYVLPHLTFEEYLAACHLAGRGDMKLAYELWASGERWRVPLLLMMGRLRQLEKLDTAKTWLDFLLAPKVESATQRRDGLFAAACYEDVGRKQTLGGYLLDSIVDELEQRIIGALHGVIVQPDAPLAERLEAGDALGRLGDSRFPITIADWQHELAQRNQSFGQPADYLCYLPGGSYQIGGWGQEQKAMQINLDAFWIARFPITVAQFAPFVEIGYDADAAGWWTPNGWQWKQGRERMQPSYWRDEGYHGLNQALVGVTWYEARAFCAWLSESLKDALPDGYEFRLPTEAEWEVAAAYDAQGQRRAYPWGKDEADLTRAIYEWADETPEGAIAGQRNIGRPAPVGLCPAGAAACGALDMAGNVWEWCASSYRGYPEQSHAAPKDFTTDNAYVPLRGGSWYWDRTYVRCGARDYYHPVNVFLNYGFRIVVAPKLAS